MSEKRRKRKEYFYRREFINRKGYHTNAHLLMNIEREAGSGDWWDIQFDIGDCGRIASLSFAVDSKSERRNSLYKMKKLKEAVLGFEKALKKAARDAEKSELAEKKRRLEEDKKEKAEKKKAEAEKIKKESEGQNE